MVKILVPPVNMPVDDSIAPKVTTDEVLSALK